MKFGVPGPTSISEINVMKYYSSQYVAKTYYSSIEDRFQLLERVSPGYFLKNVENIEQRIQTFSDLANHLSILANDAEKFKTFEEIHNEKISYVYNNKTLFSDILWMIDISNNLYDNLQKMNLPKYILHNDLHHKNILKAGTSWKAIDPHGIVGERVFECCNFIRSEIEISDSEINTIEKIITLVSEYFQEDKKLILEALYIYIIEKIICYTKDKHEPSKISYNIDICKKLLEMQSYKKEA